MLPHIRRAHCALVFGATSLLAVGVSHAETAPPYAALLAQAHDRAPRLSQAQSDVAAAQGLAVQAGARPNPVLALEVENFSGSGPYSGGDAAETTASVQQTLELGGKRQARVAAGRAGVAAAEARGALTRSDFAAQLAVAYAEAEAAGERLKQATESVASAETDAKVAQELVNAGREAELRGLQATAERQAAIAEREEAQAVRDSAFAKLSSLAGSSVLFDALSESLLTRPPPPPDSGGAEAPSITAARAEREGAAARVRVESRRSVPDLTVSAGFRRLAGEDATAFVGGVSVPFPIFDRNRGATQAARAELNGAEARLRQAELEASSDAASAQAQARSAVLRVQAATSGESAAAEAYRLARLGYDAGRLPLLELSSARRSLATARIRTLDARLAQVRAQAEIARLAGRTPFGG